MSRTDKTRPWWVQLADKPMVTCEPKHDHRFGSCTLPEHIDRSSDDSACHWTATPSVSCRRHDNGAREWAILRRADRRRSRQRSRRELRARQREN
jgi:hypothetical protein